MARSLDVILVVDVESTCWDGDPPPGQTSEIIEIGICPIDVGTLERVEKRSVLVKPVQSEISEFCTSLTTLAPAMLQRGTACSIVNIATTYALLGAAPVIAYTAAKAGLALLIIS